MAGSVVFLLLSGHFTDRVGRLPVLLGSASILTVATLGTCFAPSYPVYLVTRFLISGCTVLLYAVTGTILAECSSCARRSTLLSFSFLVGNLLADTYTLFLKWVWPSYWFYYQVLNVAPTLLVPVLSLLATESPRWLISSRWLEAAARVMRAAAQWNGSNSGGVDLLLQRVIRRLEAEIGADVTTALATDMERVVRRRAAIMFWSSFCAAAAFRSLNMYHAKKSIAMPSLDWISMCTNGFAYCVLLKFVNLIDKTRFMTITFVILGTLCLLGSITALFATPVSIFDIVGSISFVLAEAGSIFAIYFNFVYVIELFPTPLRGIAVCLSFVGARMGGTVGFLLPSLTELNLDDLTLALLATVVYSSAYSFQYLPLGYGTYARLADDHTTSTSPIDRRESMSPIEAIKHSLARQHSKKKKHKKTVTERKRSQNP
ncbi:hypothetical protein HPB48_016395 [Haemaphysalis longicornis]|uniref:Major facilitator superfamily (MFS) profile domain-containing protein n=1 Tax=Haemaphysalis longicornis TaxID=44386 RepID=A0A9J6FP73_HAELO|nr:hypothetical protein HPB48_016395 [Haemaphysalis longicornis]